MFCSECGSRLEEISSEPASVNGSVSIDSISSTGKMMGDKNVIAGDVKMVGSQDVYNTTNIYPQDEHKKLWRVLSVTETLRLIIQ